MKWQRGYQSSNVEDNRGRAFFGSESSDDPAGTKKTFGDVWVAVFVNPGEEAGVTINDGYHNL